MKFYIENLIKINFPIIIINIRNLYEEESNKGGKISLKKVKFPEKNIFALIITISLKDLNLDRKKTLKS